MFDREIWAAVPFHFWSCVFFLFGAMVGSFANVCIHRMPLEQSVVWPPSHCPHCKYSIPWFLNIPLVTWLWLRGKCKNCGAPIASRYFLVELLTGVAFLCCWLAFGHKSVGMALSYSFLLAGFIVATFIDLEHMIIPDEITIGGAVVGFILSVIFPILQHTTERAPAIRSSLLGIALAAGSVYVAVHGGKLLFGRERIKLEPDSKLVFTETCLQLPRPRKPVDQVNRTKGRSGFFRKIKIFRRVLYFCRRFTRNRSQFKGREIPYGDILYRDTDVVHLYAKTIELPEICFFQKEISLSAKELVIGDQKFVPEEVKHMELVTSELILPREAMGLGDVKFMACIGAFLGWQASIFTFFGAAVIGSIVGIPLMFLKTSEKGGKIPFGPFLALAATVWIFVPERFQREWFQYLGLLGDLVTGGPLR